MKNWAAHLLTVQNLDMRLAALETKYRTIPLEKERLKEEYRAAGEKVLASGAEVRKWEMFLKEKEAETAALDEKIKKIQIQSASVKKNSEYQALMNEIASTHAKKSEIESAQISAFDSLEAAKKSLAEAETENATASSETARSKNASIPKKPFFFITNRSEPSKAMLFHYFRAAIDRSFLNIKASGKILLTFYRKFCSLIIQNVAHLY